MRSVGSLFAAVIILMLLAVTATAQDLQVRQRAIALLENANSVSTPRVFGSYEQTVTFRAYSPTKGTQEGQFTSVTDAPRAYRDEYQFGDFHLLVIVNGAMIADVGNRDLAPVEVRKLLKLQPIYHVRFDNADIIHSIQSAQVNGRPSDCIHFDTVVGAKSDANEICIDKQLGTMARLKVGSETVTNSDFFAYRDAWVPRHIVYELVNLPANSQNDLRMELEQAMTATDGPLDPNVLSPPPGASFMHVCQAYRRPFAQFVPQPTAGDGTQTVDVILHGTIGKDGKIHDPMVDASGRADLNDEALKLFATWRFTPAICDGAPFEIPADVTLHFQGR